MLVEGDIRVPDAGLEGDLGGLERVFAGECEEELELAALLLPTLLAMKCWGVGVWADRRNYHDEGR